MQLFVLSGFTACTGTVPSLSYWHRNSKRQPAEHKSETLPVGTLYFQPFLIFPLIIHLSLIPVAARSKAWVCGGSHAENTGSNPAGSMDVFLL